MQSIAEVEAICYQRELDRAEEYMNVQDGDPTARECFDNCAHSAACRRVFGEVCRMTIEESTPDVLGCGEECEEYEEGKWARR